MYCDSNIERYIRKKHFKALNEMTPIMRSVEKLRIAIELLDININADDSFVGFFLFNEDCNEYVRFDDEVTDEATARIINAPESFNSRTTVDRGHTLVDYEAIITSGLISYEQKLERELALAPDCEELLAMKTSLDLVRLFTNKICKKLDGMLDSCSDNEREHLISLKKICEKVPYYPAESFTEALQAIWIIHFLLPLAENAWYSISLGRFDRYMYPFYKKACDDGMTHDEAKAILKEFYTLLNSYADGACLLNIGGDSYNDLSMLLIECQKEFAMPAPILAARICGSTPDNVWNELIDERLFSLGQPTFYGEEACIRALCEKGLSPQEAAEFSNNSCMGISIAGKEFNSMWGCVLTVPAILEVTLNRGRMLDKDDIIVPNVKQVTSLNELYETFEYCARYMLRICADSYEARAKLSERLEPDFLLSALTCDCIERHCDRISGAKYHNVTIECMGMVNAADGIYALNELVFNTNMHSLNEINDAVKNDFVGYEDLYSQIKTLPKFGLGTSADQFTVKLANILESTIRELDHDNLHYSPSLHTLDANVSYGACYKAGYDGRRAGAPFAKNAGPSNDARGISPTSMILSSSSIPQHRFYGGQPIDINFQQDTVKNNKKDIRTLIEVYVKRGGLQFQVNSLSSKLLRAAMDEPEKYSQLVVRVGGFSLYFSSLSTASKLEFIERFEREGY